MPMVQEGVVLEDDVVEVICYLQECFERLERGEGDAILGDPFYRRPRNQPRLSDDDIDRIIQAIDSEFAHEIASFQDYHRKRSGANSTPDFWRLSCRSRRAMVETMEAMLARHASLVIEGQARGEQRRMV